MDIKSKIIVKDEPLECFEDDSKCGEQIFIFDGIQDSSSTLTIKREKDIKGEKQSDLNSEGKISNHESKNREILKQVESEEEKSDVDFSKNNFKTEQLKIRSPAKVNQDASKTPFEVLQTKPRRINNHKCLYCTYESYHKGNLRKHMLTHSSVRMFKCTYCSYECDDKSKLLTEHVSKHINVKLFKCSDCNYVSNEKGHLQRHMLTHSDVKLFKCSECNYECNQKVYLSRHMLTHAKVKLFKCADCSYECNNKRYLKEHMLKHANVKLFKCSECSYECNRKGNLKIHMLQHVDDVENVTKI